MEIEIHLSHEPIAEKIYPPQSAGAHGAWLEFRGVVRAEENGETISALEYEAYPEMAKGEIRRILELLAAKHPCQAAKVIHRIGVIPTGEVAIYVGIMSPHRGEGLDLLTEFMNQLKRDVPIWKAQALSGAEPERRPEKRQAPQPASSSMPKPLSFEEALEEIESHCQMLPAVRRSLNETLCHVLREHVSAREDFPSHDRSTRDGYAILQNDASKTLQVVGTLYAADWKPRQLKVGETVRVATGSALPCETLRVVMQEDVERTGDTIKIVRRESGMNVRKRGEEMRAGETILWAGTNINAGTMALLATLGCAQPLVSPRLRVAHFTTGDEIVPPDQTPKPGQIRDSNSTLIRALLLKFPSDTIQGHLPENFDEAMTQIENRKPQLENSDVLLISGGASVGDKDFTGELLAHLGFEIVFSRLNIRPGAPLVFGVNGRRIAFGLPGNPISHFVCYYLFVHAALKKLAGALPQKFSWGVLASNLDNEPSPRETFLPARWDADGLHSLKWMSSGDVTCLAETNALIRIPPNPRRMSAGTKVEFLPT